MTSPKSLHSKILSLAMTLTLLMPLSGCAKTEVGASIHGVNYSADTFQYFLSDPDYKNNVGGGETVDPYSAGGTMCCFSLPKKWKPGIKIQIKISYWPPIKDNEKLKEFTDAKIVEVPRYPNGKPGELWVLRGKDGDLSIVVSDYQPDHAKWPGTIKGWPVPSLEYQRMRWDLYIKHEQGGVELFEGLLEEIKKSHQKLAQEEWDHRKKYQPSSLSPYTGPNDVEYIKFLTNQYEEMLKKNKANLEKLKKDRP